MGILSGLSALSPLASQQDEAGRVRFGSPVLRAAWTSVVAVSSGLKGLRMLGVSPGHVGVSMHWGPVSTLEN